MTPTDRLLIGLLFFTLFYGCWMVATDLRGCDGGPVRVTIEVD